MGLVSTIKQRVNARRNPDPPTELTLGEPGSSSHTTAEFNKLVGKRNSLPIPEDHNALDSPPPTDTNRLPVDGFNGLRRASDFIDLTIQFVGAEGLPRTDAVGAGSDPYFRANLDHRITYISTVQKGTLRPIWNEVWHVKNVPENAELEITVFDKDDNPLPDDLVGKFKLNLQPHGLREFEIHGRMGANHGKFFLNIIASPVDVGSNLLPYTFAGPCRYSRHKSPTVGALTALETDNRLYATWKVYMMGVQELFGDVYQHWNVNYPAAKKIFGHSPLSMGIRGVVHSAHKMLYARSTANAFGILNSANDLIDLFKDETKNNRIKPAVYTYIINDETWRFSETGAAFFVDFASKHALHANVREHVRYSGEFHWRPVLQGGWSGFTEETDDNTVQWELVIDNNSGTYSPDKNMLPVLKKFMEYNFVGLSVAVHDHDDQELKDSVNSMRTYAKEHRGIKETEFVAHPKMGETTLMNLATRMSTIRKNRASREGWQSGTDEDEDHQDPIIYPEPESSSNDISKEGVKSEAVVHN